MTARIDAHITLVHDVVDHDETARQVVDAASDVGPFAVTLTAPGRWGRASFGVYLDVLDASGTIDELHRRLAPFEAPAWSRVLYRPHVTLVHGRTVAPELAAPAWAALRDQRVDWSVELTAIDVIELDDATGWHRVERRSLTAAAAVTD